MTTIEFKFPVEGPGGTFRQLTLRRPRAKDLAAMTRALKEQGDVQAMIAYVASNAELPLPVVENMDAEDFKAVSEAAEDFLPQA
jgi:hypothetical protein